MTLRIAKRAVFLCLLLSSFCLLLLGKVSPFGGITNNNASLLSYPQWKPSSIIIPKIKLNEPVYDDPVPGVVRNDFLNKGPAYYDENTNQPGQGNCVIAGHSATTSEHGAPFARVNSQELKSGDIIILTDKNNKAYKYIITEIKIVAANDFSVIQKTKHPSVTLITCIPPDYPRDKRLIVRGVLQE